ncbi:hypothetical protein HPB51_010871 [Rhipicephalus microplus]|uniref:Uncharacterized protein n=1 Tax=Rhipicephalus microplus TaxID=6941 RepID=A0A9J6DLZ7_RHIMP|nr:hypothetical protein HPB51_010871 [Rhipicephalus microplus]
MSQLFIKRTGSSTCSKQYTLSPSLSVKKSQCSRGTVFVGQTGLSINDPSKVYEAAQEDALPKKKREGRGERPGRQKGKTAMARLARPCQTSVSSDGYKSLWPSPMEDIRGLSVADTPEERTRPLDHGRALVSDAAGPTIGNLSSAAVLCWLRENEARPVRALPLWLARNLFLATAFSPSLPQAQKRGHRRCASAGAADFLYALLVPRL